MPTIWTIGHSTRSADEFLDILRAHGIRRLVDVRRFPGSRRHPHFGREALAGLLEQAGIDYLWLPELGGRRDPRPDSPNTAWRNSSFRGYADYMDTAPFEEAMSRLIAAARERPTAILCAEALWWRCHRALISDYLKVRNSDILHITDATHATPHPYTSAARIVDGRLSYAAEDPGHDAGTLL